MNIGPNRYRERYYAKQRSRRIKAENLKTLSRSKGASRKVGGK